MSVTELHDLFAYLALVALGGTVVMVAARVIPAVAGVRFLDAIYRVQLPLAALVATTATLGSLWFSEHGKWIPCRFCWFQRIFMYSAAVVLIVAALRRDRGAKWYVVPLASIGILLSTWHILLEHGVVEDSKVCAATTPCANPWYVSIGSMDPNTMQPAEWYGITLAVMAFCGFAAILALLLIPEHLDTAEEEDHGEPSEG